jgi:cytochrome P450
VPTIFRRATRPATIAGVDLPEGADVLLSFASANRDEDRYPDAGRFDVTRTPARHFGFGAGVHTCVGAPAARTQARIALRTLVERLPGLRRATDGSVPIRRSINVRGPLTLPLRW